MTDMLPNPLTPANCDLRDYEYLPLKVVQLRDSDMAATPDGEVFRAAVLSWCAAWHQVPAASLPDDNAAIARLIGMGRDVAGMTALREAGALRGFIKCGDGRLYHPVVAERALIAWDSKVAQRNRTAAARAAYLEKHPPGAAKKAAGKAATQPVTASVTAFVTESKVSKGKGSEDKDSKKEAPAAPPAPVLVSEKPLPDQIPNRIPLIPWEAFVAMRKKIKKPLMDRALTLMLSKLGKLHLAGHDIGAIVDQSVLNQWQDVFPLRPDGEFRGQKSASSSFGSAVARVVRQRQERHFRGFGEGLSDPDDEGGTAGALFGSKLLSTVDGHGADIIDAVVIEMGRPRT